jgi:hypothetical protein
LNVAGTLTVVNITSTNSVETNITTVTLLATTSVSSGILNATNSTITNAVHTTLSSGNAIFTIGLTTANIFVSGLSNLNGNSNTIGNIFTTGGNVGVGTIAPQSTLDIVNNNPILIIRDGVFQKGKIYFGNSSHGVGRGANIGTLADVNDVLLWTNGGSVGFATESSERMRITNAGNVGIGTNSPAYTLDVNGTSRVSRSLTIGTDNTPNFAHQTITSNLNFPMAFCANPGNFGSFIFGNGPMSTGYVSINSIISGYMLDVDGSGRFTGALAATNNSNTVGNIFTTAGNVGIGTTSPGYKLHVNGDIYSSGDITAFSDIRLKENIVQLSGCLDKIDNIRGVSFNRIDTGRKHIGLIAQEVEMQFPELVATDLNTGYKSVNYGNVVAVLLECIRELKVEVNGLK